MNQDILSICDKEPIHIPGAIQSHGFLIATNSEFNIIWYSENIVDYVSDLPATIIGASLSVISDLISDRASSYLQNLIEMANATGVFLPLNPYPIKIQDEIFNLILSQSAFSYVLEFEIGVEKEGVSLPSMVGQSLAQMLSGSALDLLLEQTAQQVRSLIGYDRVMIYKFHHDGHGEVVAEAKSKELDSFLGYHYPASDIPKQARQLYLRNLIRIIANVDENAVPLKGSSELKDIPLDLSDSVLRAVSPVHIQYLKNMGVASSFSVSLVNKDKLWGLIACHNYTPRFVDYRDRESAKLVGQVLSSAISFRQMEIDQVAMDRLKNDSDRVVRALLHTDFVPAALMAEKGGIISVLDCTGAALSLDNIIYVDGECPPPDFIAGLVTWLSSTMNSPIFESGCLSELYSEALAYKDVASGLLACQLSAEANEYMLWFRPELISSVVWAGKPEKANIVSSDQSRILQINPRQSFEAWYEQILLHSAPWTYSDERIALRLREEVFAAYNRKIASLKTLHGKLKEAYDELDSFSYTLTHDLKSPLTSIKAYSQLLSRNVSDNSNALHMVQQIEKGAEKMQLMIKEVLAYSRWGQEVISFVSIDMYKLLSDIRGELVILPENQNLKIFIEKAPSITGDKMMITQIFSNLIGNAVKYSSSSRCPLITVGANIMEEEIIYYVRDNGIGISKPEQEKIFMLFKRADNSRNIEGSGVGLAIVKKMLEKHLGKIWVESELGKGACFYLSFPMKIG